jgi:hypothetical protein
MGSYLNAHDDHGNDVTGELDRGWLIQIAARVRR